jgi:non-lysosomal glucosylceramidase
MRTTTPKTEASPAPATPQCSCGGSTALDRRCFLKTSALAAAGLTFARLPVMAGPFTREDFDTLVPADKKLAPEWVQSLFARGERTVYRGKELETIGMPIGGICAGQLYLGGDGKLWHWDIFNQPARTDGGNYLHPLTQASPLEQGFALEVTVGAKKHVRPLDRSGFADIGFCGEYPLANLEYRDPQLPVAVALEAFSPFVPLNTEDSSLPATVLRYTVKNTGSAKVEVRLAGWLENAVCLVSAPGAAAKRRNRVTRGRGMLLIKSDVENGPAEKTVKPALLSEADLRQPLDMGTMAIALLEPASADRAAAAVGAGNLPEAAFAAESADQAAQTNGRKLIGALVRTMSLDAGQEASATFLITWHFPYLDMQKWNIERMEGLKDNGRFYATKFPSAAAVAEHVAVNFAALHAQTRLWHDTWYDSTLPYWFLDRTLLNTSSLASSTAHRFATGRFWGWEGVGCCEGTCTHVWHYAHAAARLFPELERDLRTRTDFGTAIEKPSGAIRHRGEGFGLAVDGQAGCILRAYREYQMTTDGALLAALWPNVKLAMQCLITLDKGDGLLDGAQHNTLDAAWYGQIAWLSGLYLASLRAAAEMAADMGDAAFAAECRRIADTGRQSMVTRLFEREYFINQIDTKHLEALNSGSGCEIDQVFGQSWAFQVGLGRVLPEKETRAALQSLWRYNFTPDCGAYRQVYKTGRWFALAGEAGMLMCTFPRKDWSFENAIGKGNMDGLGGLFNEVMNGFEYQVAGHMLWEGMVKEGLAVTRAVHDRYHASKRNPWNEVECGDHYARSMASYGVFLAACGFEYHGPKRHIGFAPRLTPEDFKSAFTSAEGWGSLDQRRTGTAQRNRIEVKWGGLRLKTLAFELPLGVTLKATTVTVGEKRVAVSALQTGRRVEVTLAEEAALRAKDVINAELAFA